jgi:diguanylate cyclase (GGDEF)-like protein
MSGPKPLQALAAGLLADVTGEVDTAMARHAYYDAVTGLPNRTLAERELERLLGRPDTVKPLALILIDLRNLRRINASFGHRVGDEALRTAALRLRETASPEELVARLGESRLLVIAQLSSSRACQQYASRLAEAVDRDIPPSGIRLDLHVASGVSLYPAHGRAADELLQHAEVALEFAEETGSGPTVYGPGRDDELRRRLTLVTDLRTAIEQGQLSIVYQPKIAVGTGAVTSLEALARWNHPKLGPISPGEFVPLAERSGGSRRLTSWVMNVAIGQLAQWRNQGLQVEMAVNLSAPDILDPGLGEEILRLLGGYDVETAALLLEITESAVMRDPQLAARNMQLLRMAGVRFAIDDFGTGYSSMAQLSLLPADEIKIDRSLVARAHLRYEIEQIVKSTIELAHSIGLNVVAEGVEDAATWRLLCKLNCDLAQGYLVSPPLPAADVPPFAAKANRLLPP